MGHGLDGLGPLPVYPEARWPRWVAVTVDDDHVAAPRAKGGRA